MFATPDSDVTPTASFVSVPAKAEIIRFRHRVNGTALCVSKYIR